MGICYCLGTFNIHWDIQEHLDTRKLVELLDSSNLVQHVRDSTHTLGHTIDLVVTRSDDNLIGDVTATTFISDHRIINISTKLTKPQIPSRTISYRKYRDIDLAGFQCDLHNSDLISNSPDDLHELCELYDSTISKLIDHHAPQISMVYKRHSGCKTSSSLL